MLQICYASRAAVAFDVGELKALLKKARENNHRAGISGLLLHQDGSFLQLLEGPEKVVIETYNRIRRDTRHTDLQILFKEKIEDRSFESWDMGFVNADDGDSAQLPGFLAMFERGFKAEEFRKDQSRAKLVFVQFRDGLWHRGVNVA